jgi:UDP-N-acetyl-D-glucosamine dehydrogenase
VGGIDPESTRRAVELYKKVAQTVIPLSSPRVAELTKVFENVFRSVNIALVNELAQLCYRLGISVWEVLDAAATKPYGYMQFSPGPGVGGHCIPLDPYYLANKAREYDFHTRFIELAGEINEAMPYWVVSRLTEALNDRGKSLRGAKILILGLAYKPDIGDLRESPSVKLSELLLKKGAILSYNDPYITQVKLLDDLNRSSELTSELLELQDCIVIATNHSRYDYPWICKHAKLLFDCWGATKGISAPNILRL